MTGAAIALLACAAVLHASWNFVAKRATPSRAFFMLSDSIAVLCLTPLLIFWFGALADIPALVWGMLLLTGACQAAYYASLAASYRSGDLSVTYPLARAGSSAITALAILLLGRRREIGDPALLGIALITLGGYLLPRRTLRGKSAIPAASLGWALAAASATAGYSVIDDTALRFLTGSALLGIPYGATILLYGTLEGISTVFSLFVSLVLRGELGQIGPLLKREKARCAFTGLATYASYILVLAAMPLCENVSYAVGFRQLSIPLGVIAGIAFLREPSPAPRILGTGAILGGVLLLAAG